MKTILKNIVLKLARMKRSITVQYRYTAQRFNKRGGFRGMFSRFISDIKRGSFAAIGVCIAAFIMIAGGIALASAIGKTAASQAEGSTISIDIDSTAAPAPTATPAPTPQPTPTPVSLGKGTSGEKVMEVQMRLMELGYMDYDEPTEYFGSITKNAVELFQRRHNLEVDGYIGEETYDKLMRADAMTYMVTIGDEGTDIEELQKRLVELDYMDKATGYFGEETAAAVKEFQSRNDLSADGMIGVNTREVLYSDSAVARSFSYGESGDEILRFQNRLYKLGYLTTEPDGTFGRDTLSAVKLFQELNGLIADGHIGPMTRTVLLSGDAQANALTIGMSGSTVKNVQKKLKALGYLSSADGYYGTGTESAVRAFQKQNGLSVDGKVGKNTMSLLLSGKAKKAPSDHPASTSGGGSATPSPTNISGGASASRLIDVALSKLGSKYVSGGKGPNTFDCSGFVYWCLNQAGVKQSYMTSKTWRSVSKYQKISSLDSCKKGDILVFRMSSSSGHVGIAINDSEMVDASSGNGKVVRRSYKTSYWYKYFYCAYRIF